MRVGDLTDGITKLHEALDALQRAWAEATIDWDDANSRSFQENQLEPILPKLKLALDATNRLGDVLARARRDCE
jgi:hypothetical protein